MEKDIWKNIKIDEKNSKDNLASNFNRLRKYNFSMNWLNLRNYINRYSVDEINISTLESWFGNNLYQSDNDGNFIIHLLSFLKYIPIEKRCKALEISFQIFGPNLGAYNKENYNYFQSSLLYSRRPYLLYSSNDLRKMYEIGIKYGLDINYVDSFNNSFVAYLLSISPFKIIEELYEILLISGNVSEWEKNLEILEIRTEYKDIGTDIGTYIKNTIFNNIISSRYNSMRKNQVEYLPNWNYYNYYPFSYEEEVYYEDDREKNERVYNNIKKRIKELSK